MPGTLTWRANPDAQKADPPPPRKLPGKDDILEFIRSAPAKVGKREIARAFGIRGDERLDLNRMLAGMRGDGTLVGNRKDLTKKGGLPPVTVLEVTGRDEDGDLIAKPAVWEGAEGERPSVLLPAHQARGPQADVEAEIGIGDRILARITELKEADVEGYRFEASPIKRLPREKRRLVGIYRAHRHGGGTIEPIDRKQLRSWSIHKGDEGQAKDGDLVRFDLARKGRHHVPQARILETLGNPDDQRQISLIAVHTHGIPDDFPESVIAESKSLEPPRLQGRTDLRALPLVTIDPPDARDHDDAVFAEPDADPANADGWVVIVAIADVAHYVRPGTKLDREAQMRGNSVYFPDRVVPMLPERISNDLCSLREGEDRPCLAVRLVIDKNGNKKSHTFLRAMMRSAAKLSYQEAQAAIDGKPSEKCQPLMERVLQPLWAAYGVMAEARDRRQPLDLDLPERKIVLDEAGRVARIVVPERLTAHRLIEEFMIQANVAAAEALEGKRAAVVYRIHDQPSKEKLKSLREFLDSLDIKLAPQGTLKPEHFNRILDARQDRCPCPSSSTRWCCAARARPSTTSTTSATSASTCAAMRTSPRPSAAMPISSRTARSSARLKLGAGGLEDFEIPRLPEISKSISEAERRAMAAERETVDRLIAAHLADRIGATFSGRVAGVTRSGLFVRLADTGADGFVPVSVAAGRLLQSRRGAARARGQAHRRDVQPRRRGRGAAVEAIPSAGALRFEMLSEGKKTRVATMRAVPKHAGKRWKRR